MLFKHFIRFSIVNYIFIFTPDFKGYAVLVFTCGIRLGGWLVGCLDSQFGGGKVFSELYLTYSHGKLIFGKGYWCAVLWCHPNATFDVCYSDLTFKYHLQDVF